ncbi:MULTISPECIES: MFS transporter [Paraburkholderia]|uniref:MFS transporter n=1 Tax=Paraburkholderia TaxID=1822464 RepID=UPI0022550B74|nr:MULTISPECIES: MFS transporter [Paraburkholderia]MCX4166020.1 MFS transporter [Paraburkholderia megapolitana]MDN7161510.1 MFS transporter [Paraburkholderia sp. CHISQ3]MDQ6498558.1 MFS transporter [Paraburkholderia megapolitana]
MNPDSVADAPSPSSPARSLTPREMRRAIVTSVLGNGFEWFDFMAYAYFAKVIGQVFFPGGNSVASLSLALATFALGFVVRPFGGVLLGIYADRAGRARAFSLLMLMMATGTLLLGLAPGYATIGIAAPLLVLLARLIQGLAIGGQFSMSAVIVVESAPPGKKMFYGSFNMSAQALATLLSAGLSYLLTDHLSTAALTSWGWRVPFLIGTLVGPLGFYIRHRVSESPEFDALRKLPREKTVGLSAARNFIDKQGDAALCAIGVMVIGTASSYLWNAYMPVYVERQLHLPMKWALFGTFVASSLNFVLFPFAGKLVDRIGAYRLFYPVVITWAICTLPLFWFIVSAPSAGRLLTAQIVAALFQVAIAAGHPGMLATLFPAHARTTGVALSYNLAVTLFGGMAPLTVTLLTQQTGSRFVPAFYVIAAALISLALVRFTRTGQAALAADRARRAERVKVTTVRAFPAD